MIVLLRKIAHCPHRLFFLSSLVILAFSSQDNLWGADAGGEPNDSSRILTLNGRVDISRDSGANWTPGRTNMVLNLGNRVRTGRRSRTTIQMTDKSVLRVRQLSTLVIQAPKSSASKPVLDGRSSSDGVCLRCSGTGMWSCLLTTSFSQRHSRHVGR